MAITVAELVADPLLKLRFIAGQGGGARLVTWAHTSDLPNPTEWLGPGDLLMSNGLNIFVGRERAGVVPRERGGGGTERAWNR